MKAHNPFYRELAEIKSAFLSAITPENAITLCRQLQRDCLQGNSKSRAEAWNRFLKLLKLLGLSSINPDMVKADEMKVYSASPPPMIEKMMRKESPKPQDRSSNSKFEQVCKD